MSSLAAGDWSSIDIYDPVSFSLDDMSLDPTLQIARILLNIAWLDLAIVDFAAVSAELSLVQRAVYGAMRTAKTFAWRYEKR
jgi:hypothetical protein